MKIVYVTGSCKYKVSYKITLQDDITVDFYL